MKITIQGYEEEIHTTIGIGETYEEAEANAEANAFPELTKTETYYYAGLTILLLFLITLLAYRVFTRRERQDAAIEKTLSPGTTLNIDPELVKKLEIYAKMEDRTTSKQAERIIREYIQNYELEHGEIKKE